MMWLEDHGNSGVKGFDFIKLAQMLCIDYPSEVLHGILRMLDKREEENVDFDDFLAGIKNILIFDGFFDEMEGLFKYLDKTKSGKVSKDILFKAIEKLERAKV
jgi:Ca2+-binding EF-hand superfamily protein